MTQFTCEWRDFETAVVNTMRLRSIFGTLVVVTAMFAAITTTPAQESKGDLWETTSQIVMEGVPFKMPANTVKVCAPKEWKEPPGGSDRSRNCKTSNMRVMGNKVTWDVQCTGPTMNGTGELVRDTADTYTGTIKFSSAEGNMTVQLKGRKVGGCDSPQ